MSHIYLHCISPLKSFNSLVTKMDTLFSLLRDLSYFMTLSSMAVWAVEIPKLTRKIRKLLPLSVQETNDILHILHHDATDENKNLKDLFLSDIAGKDISDLLKDDLDMLDDIARVSKSVASCYLFFYDCDVAKHKVAECHTISKIIKGIPYSLNTLTDAIRDSQSMEAVDGRVGIHFHIWNSIEAYVMGIMTRTEFIDIILDPLNYFWYKDSKCFSVLVGFNKYINK
uniref:p26 n=1 Tax=Little cherry virus 2 TaxID=154339 RepID=A0A679GBX6_9CLOS|nr:p26 [Little cherry virus 2]